MSNETAITVLLFVALPLMTAPLWVRAATRRREKPDPNDVFGGNRRTITLPPGWLCDRARWEWRVVAIDPAEHTTTYGLYVFTEHPETGSFLWRPVGQGVPFYAHGETFGEIPGSWRQETKVLPSSAERPA